MPGVLSRRSLLGAAMGFGMASLASAALASRALAAPGRSVAEELSRRAQERSIALMKGKIKQTAWQDAMAAIARDIPVEELSRAIDLDVLIANAPSVERGASVVYVKLSPEPAFSPRFVTKIFVLKQGRANPPHAHDNMVSMHHVLRGRFRVRHFDRVRDEAGGFILRPTIDRKLGPGEGTSISDARDNVHWHLAETDGVLLDVLCAGLDQTRPTSTHLVDPVGAERLDGGLLRARHIKTVEEALARFG
jgi:quercetin dioxygenase-like cupin family protein